ncbi:MAG: TIGR00282 family metallophosphoesterase [Clostridia bacterium]|nr:TIGR00282 family metallophosphoesterase [Clostridia bacterium]
MKILAIGDVVGTNGCDFLRKTLPSFKRNNGIDLCIVNGENSAQGNGILPQSAEHLLTSGADVITTGNHAFRRFEIYNKFDEEGYPLIRPANFYRTAHGRGYYIIDKGFIKIAVVNLSGTVYLENNDNPFDCIDRILDEVSDCRIKIVDFHAEATAEKRAMGFYLDGKVSAVFGTHTHVQTNDAQVLPLGTGYITDIGMTGPVQSVLGITPSLAIEKIRTNLPVRFENPDGECKMEGCIFEIDNKTGKTIKAQTVSVT